MNYEKSDEITLRLKEEQLDIKRNWVETGQVNWYKEVLTEEKNITVPILREELVIEKTFSNPESPAQAIRSETIRIPLREERVEINKITYNLEEADIYKKQIQQTEAIEAALKKEVLALRTSGQIDIRTN